MNTSVLPIHRAIEIASAAGARAELVCSVVQEEIHFSVALTTHDRAPAVSIRLPTSVPRSADMYLGERDAFGPDSWDYPAHIARPADRFALRLWYRDQGHIDVPVLPAAGAILLQGGWATAPDAKASAVVANDAFVAALESLRCLEPQT